MTDEPRATLDTDRMLLDFVAGRDIECPLCGYNLRDLTKPTCPECEHALEMRVGVQRLRLLPFVLAITPGICAGLCATVLTVIMTLNFIMNNGQFVGVEWPVVAFDLLGWGSAVFTVYLIVTRYRFLAAPLPRQRVLVMAIWIANVLAFFVLLAIVLMFG